MKHTYCLVLNDGQIVMKPIAASYGNNHSILLHIKERGILIQVVTGAEKLPEIILNDEDGLFSDTIRKALLIYLIRYGKSLSVTKAVLSRDGSETNLYEKRPSASPLIFSMVEGKLRIPFTEKWRDNECETLIASTSRTAYDGRFNALHSLTIAKSDRYESERLLYYWMAVNGLYNYVASQEKDNINQDAYRNLMRNDKQKQEKLLSCYGYNLFMVGGSSRNERNSNEKKARNTVVSVLKQISLAEIDAFCEACLNSDTDNPYVRQILGIVCKYGNGINGVAAEEMICPFMVIWLPYKLRCESFHAERCLPTICFRNDRNLNALRVINCLLDRFLTEELFRWFVKK